MNDLPQPNAMAPLRLLLADDHAIVREGYRRLIERRAHLRLVAEADTAEQALQLYREFAPDVAVIDLNLPEMGGFELVRRLLQRDPRARVLVRWQACRAAPPTTRSTSSPRANSRSCGCCSPAAAPTTSPPCCTSARKPRRTAITRSRPSSACVGISNWRGSRPRRGCSTETARNSARRAVNSTPYGRNDLHR